MVYLFDIFFCNRTSMETEFQRFLKSRKVQAKDKSELILELASLDPISPSQVTLLNKLVLEETNEILVKHGNKYDVRKGKKKGRPFKIGKCYSVAASMMQAGYGYVEGYVTHKIDGIIIPHAWNLDKSGNHFDFIFPNVNLYYHFEFSFT